jgi:glyceraldehyde-3-phosphate dehydrogenase/erythrose-4-phosphate dehydrogenase
MVISPEFDPFILHKTPQNLDQIQFGGISQRMSQHRVKRVATFVLDGKVVKLLAWYDNEWGYSCRLIDLAARLAAS